MTEFENPELNLWDCRVRHFDGWTLEIIGGVSSSMEIAPTKILRFNGVSYLECPIWSVPWSFIIPRFGMLHQRS